MKCKIMIPAVLMVIFLFWTPSIAASQFFEAGVQQLETPVKAPDFALKVLGSRKTISLKGLRGKIVVLTFFSRSCAVCEKQVASFDKLDEEIKSEEIVFLLVADGGTEKDLLKFKNDLKLSLPILMDKNRSVAKAYGVRGHHETFFINRESKIIGKTFAEKDWTSAAMKSFIEYLLEKAK